MKVCRLIAVIVFVIGFLPLFLVRGQNAVLQKDNNSLPTMGLIRDVAMSPDGKYAFAGDCNGAIWVCDVAKRQVIRVIQEEPPFVSIRTVDKEKGIRIIKHTFPLESTFPSFAFSADGKLAVVGHRFRSRKPPVQQIGESGTLVWAPAAQGKTTFWDLPTGRKLDVRCGNDEAVYGVALSQDGKWAITANAEKAMVFAGWDRPPYQLRANRLWDLSKGELVRTLPKGLTGAAFSKDGRAYVGAIAAAPAVGKGLELRLCETATGKQIQTIEIPQINSVCCIAFSPDGKHVAVASNRSVSVCSLANAKLLWSDQALCRYPIKSVAFSPDGKFVLATGPATDYLTSVPPGTNGAMVLLHVATGKKVARFKGPTDWVRSAGFAPDGKLIFGATANGVQFWASDTGNTAFSLKE